MYFVHYKNDDVFERFGGVYVPYATEDEAKDQVAWDLLNFDDDIEALGVQSIFQAEYGGHRIGNPDAMFRADRLDYNQPLGHLDKDKRKEIAKATAIVKEAKKRRGAMLDSMGMALVDHVLAIHHGRFAEAEIKAAKTRWDSLTKEQQNNQPGSAWTVVSGGTATGGAIALTAATAKTVMMLIAGSSDQPLITEFAVSFDGVTASAVPVLVEAISSTQATAGTNTSMTPKQVRGWPGQTPQTTAAYNYTAEGTTYEAYKKRLLTPNGGLIIVQNPLGREPTGNVTASTQFKGIGIRLTAPAGVNCHVDGEFEE